MSARQFRTAIAIVNGVKLDGRTDSPALNGCAKMGQTKVEETGPRRQGETLL